MFDVIIVGGATAGLSAALVLGRARRDVLVYDAGRPRNAPSLAAHSFFSRDGIAPTELLRIGREQLAVYPSVELHSGVVVDVRWKEGYFEVVGDDQMLYTARKLLLATGVQDVLPPIPGIGPLWGRGIFHCPYCHGWEVRDQPLALIWSEAVGVEMAVLLKQWSRDLVVCTNGPASFSDEEWEKLRKLEVPVREERIVRLEGGDDGLVSLVFASGEPLRRSVFLRPEQRLSSDLLQRLGCEITELGKGSVELVKVDQMGQTTVPGVYAAGDITSMFQQVVWAAASGAMAAGGINAALAMEDVG